MGTRGFAARTSVVSCIQPLLTVGAEENGTHRGSSRILGRAEGPVKARDARRRPGTREPSWRPPRPPLLLIAFFGVRLRWLPVYGAGTFAHLVLPAVSLSTIILGRLARLVRASMLEVLGQDYVRTARAKGVAEPRVLAGHALKNAAIPIVTLLGSRGVPLSTGVVP